jgi:monoamine oxidase
MFCELGGELVDTNHKPLIDLAGELGVGIQRVKPAHGGGEDLYAIGGRVHAEHELLRHGRGAFLPIARRIARDKQQLIGEGEAWSDHARRLDTMSIAGYLAQFRGHVPDWVLDLLDLAYWGEYGLRTDRQSSLNLVDLIGAEPKGDFEMFGESDEVYRIAGGSSSLPDALYARLGDGVDARPAHALDAIARDGDGIQLALTSGGTRFYARHDVVVLALPFTKLREVKGIDTLGLEANKVQCIRELGYGDNAKVMLGTTSRPWTGAAHLPVKSDGEFYATEFQVAWDTSRGQDGTRGILTNYLSGVEDQAAALAGMRAGFEKISPAIAASFDESNTASFFWARYPFNKGSFVAPKVGQYTTLLEVAGTPELGGRLQFAGEHTSADFAGFMCGGVDSGERAAKAVLAADAHAQTELPRAA